MAQATIIEAAQLFSEAVNSKSHCTATNYRTSLKLFLAFLPSINISGDSPPSCLPPSTLEDFYLYTIRKGAQRGSAATYIAGVRSFLRFIQRRGWLAVNASLAIMSANLAEIMPRQHYTAPIITDDGARLVVAILTEPLPDNGQERIVLLRDRAAIAMLYSTGMRRAEVASLSKSDVSQNQAIVRGKGDRYRAVYFDDDATVTIDAYLLARSDPYAPLLIRHDDGRGEPGEYGNHWRLSPHSVWEIIRCRAQQFGLNVHPHDLRHLKARVLLNNGAQLVDVQHVLGHESIGITSRIYAPYSKQSVQRAWKEYSLPARAVAGKAAPFLER